MPHDAADSKSSSIANPTHSPPHSNQHRATAPLNPSTLSPVLRCSHRHQLPVYSFFSLPSPPLWHPPIGLPLPLRRLFPLLLRQTLAELTLSPQARTILDEHKRNRAHN